MCGCSNDVLWTTDDEKLGVRVYAGCIHPALGEDITAQVVQGQELKELLARIKQDQAKIQKERLIRALLVQRRKEKFSVR